MSLCLNMISKKVIFLDRDGVINKERKDYVKTKEELEIFPNIVNSIKKLKDDGFYIIVVTNQSAINRKLMTQNNVEEIHNEIQEYMKNHDTSIDDFYYCPHRPDENCSCRKPKSGLLLQAKKDYNIIMEKSWIIGDNDSDIESGTSVGCRGIKITENFGLENATQKILKSK